VNSFSKRLLYYFTRVSQVLAPILHFIIRPKADSRVVTFYPAFDNLNDLSDQVNRLKWYIPNKINTRVFICVKGSLKDVNISLLPHPDYHRNPLPDSIIPEILAENEMNAALRSSDVVCLWNLTKPFVGLFRQINWFRLRIVDPNFYLFSETHSYPAMFWYDLLTRSERNSILHVSKEHFARMFNQLSGKRAYIFGTGPSIRRAFEYNFSDGVRIICNSMVKDDEMLEYIQPQILVFVDSVFHFGVSKYSGEFAQDLIKVVRKYHPYIITNQVGGALLQAHYPELSEKLIVVKAIRFGSPVRLTPESFGTRDYTNVLTRYLLPLGAGLAREVILLGFDGRAPAEKYFWKHNASTQYTEKMDSTQLSHPAFFRDVSYDGYYQKHCKVLGNMAVKFEKEGVSIHTLTQSYIPALKARQQIDENSSQIGNEEVL
jgi:hypothetical protein